MKKIFILPVIFLAGSISFISMAQTQFTGWTALFTTFKTGKKTSIHADVQLRSSDELKQIQTLLLRSGLNIHPAFSRSRPAARSPRPKGA